MILHLNISRVESDYTTLLRIAYLVCGDYKRKVGNTESLPERSCMLLLSQTRKILVFGSS